MAVLRSKPVVLEEEGEGTRELAPEELASGLLISEQRSERTFRLPRAKALIHQLHLSMGMALDFRFLVTWPMAERFHRDDWRPLCAFIEVGEGGVAGTDLFPVQRAALFRLQVTGVKEGREAYTVHQLSANPTSATVDVYALAWRQMQTDDFQRQDGDYQRQVRDDFGRQVRNRQAQRSREHSRDSRSFRDSRAAHWRRSPDRSRGYAK